jgi:DNA-binding LacI/PurR family transcriptional regulator
LTVTIKDIARAAGVSHSTVSRALRDHPAIAAQTSGRIKALAVEMGYVPSAVARGLKTSRTQALGVIVTRIDDPFFSELLQGIEKVLREMGYSLFVAASNRDFRRERSIVQAMRERRVDGVILCSTQFSEDHYRQLKGVGLPIVVVGNQEISSYRPMIVHDDFEGSRQITRHLIDLGHTKIAFLGNGRAERTTQSRLSGYCHEMIIANLPVQDGYVFQAPNGRPDGGDIGVKHFLKLPDPPTAIQCFNDMMAIGALKSLREGGISVPEECSVVGFDDIPLSAYVFPSLTTFQQPKFDLGTQAAQMMARLLQDPPDSALTDTDVVTFRGRLVVRNSTAPCLPDI